MFGQYKTSNIPQAMFNTFFMLRRSLYALSIVFLPAFPMTQAFWFMVICLPILAYHLVMNPYIDAINNILMNINEISLIAWGWFFFIFAEPDSDTQRIEILGWTVIGIIVSVILLNVVVLWALKVLLIKRDIAEFIEKTRKTNLDRYAEKKAQERMRTTQRVIQHRYVKGKLDLMELASHYQPSQFLRINQEEISKIER
jgi:hypothetical protein